MRTLRWPWLPLLAAAACAPVPGAVEPPQAMAPAAVPVAAAGQARLPMTLAVPLGQTAPPAAFGSAPAPVPNRDIEAPPDRLTDPRAPRLEPMVLAPERRQGMTFGSEHLRDSGGDRGIDMPGVRLPLDNLLPGARVRIPFE